MALGTERNLQGAAEGYREALDRDPAATLAWDRLGGRAAQLRKAAASARGPQAGARTRSGEPAGSRPSCDGGDEKWRRHDEALAAAYVYRAAEAEPARGERWFVGATLCIDAGRAAEAEHLLTRARSPRTDGAGADGMDALAAAAGHPGETWVALSLSPAVRGDAAARRGSLIPAANVTAVRARIHAETLVAPDAAHVRRHGDYSVTQIAKARTLG